MRQGISAIRALQGERRTHGFCAFLPPVLEGSDGRRKDFSLVEQGFPSVAKTGEQASSPSLHHAKGQLLLAQNPSDGAKAEQCFRTAMENRAATKCETRGVARDDKSHAAAQRAGPPRRSSHDARRNLRLVHRRLRHGRSERRQGLPPIFAACRSPLVERLGASRARGNFGANIFITTSSTTRMPR
jgi:hypothetical protein